TCWPAWLRSRAETDEPRNPGHLRRGPSRASSPRRVASRYYYLPFLGNELVLAYNVVVMTANDIRTAYLKFMADRGHAIIPRENLVPKGAPTTLCTGSGMQPLVPYLLGAQHPEGKRVADSQPSFRAEDIDEVGDNRHTTLFEMLGNWSLG